MRVLIYPAIAGQTPSLDLGAFQRESGLGAARKIG